MWKKYFERFIIQKYFEDEKKYNTLKTKTNKNKNCEKIKYFQNVKKYC